jgi:hypothetical protein
MFNSTFNNILAILQHSVLMVEETGVPRKKQQTKHPGFSNRNQNLPGKYYPLP